MRRHRIVAVELPVRIIRREQEHLVGADLLDHVGDACGIRRAVERLHGDADMVADDRSRLTLDPRHLDAHAAPGLVGAPHEGGQPAHARLHQHDLEAGKFAEHAFIDQAQYLGLKRLRFGEIILVAIRRPADRTRRGAVGAAGMDADGKAMLLGRGIDRPVRTLAERYIAHDQHQHLHETLVLGAALDLGHGFFHALRRDHDRAAQPRILVEPFPGEPVVDRAAERILHVLGKHHLHAIERIADTVSHTKAIQRLALHVVIARAGFSLRRPPVGPRRDRRIGRIGLRDQIGHAARRHLVAPVVVHVGQQAGQMRNGGMQIAIHAAGKRRRHGVSSFATAASRHLVGPAAWFCSRIQAGWFAARNSANAGPLC